MCVTGGRPASVNTERTNETLPTKKTTEKKAAPKPKAAAEASKEATPTQPLDRKTSKTDTVLALLRQPGGTTLEQLKDATGWQAHSVRGFLSGTVGKKMGLRLESAKGEDGARVYALENE